MSETPPPSRIRSHRPHDITGSYRSSGQVRTGPDKGKLREKTRSQQTLPQYPALRSPVSHLLPTCDRSEPNAPRTVIRAVGPATRPPQRPTQASGEQSDRLALRARIEHPLPEKSRSTNVHASPVLTLGRKTDASAPIPPHAPPDPLHNLTRPSNRTRAIRASYASAPRNHPSASPRPEQNERSRPRIPRRRPLFFLRLPDV